jgi:hypothetical protein
VCSVGSAACSRPQPGALHCVSRTIYLKDDPSGRRSVAGKRPQQFSGYRPIITTAKGRLGPVLSPHHPHLGRPPRCQAARLPLDPPSDHQTRRGRTVAAGVIDQDVADLRRDRGVRLTFRVVPEPPAHRLSIASVFDKGAGCLTLPANHADGDSPRLSPASAGAANLSICGG